MFTLDFKLTEWENIPIYKLEDNFWDTGPEKREYPGRAYLILTGNGVPFLRDVEWDVPKDPDREPYVYRELRRQFQKYNLYSECAGWVYQEDLVPLISNLLTKKGVIEDGNT